MQPPRDWRITLLFLLCLTFFLERGAYRALRYETAGDFSTVYAAARCWLDGSNPYESFNLKAELAEAGAPLSVQRDQDVNPSVYLPSAFPWMALIACLPWWTANALWVLFSLVVVGWSLLALTRATSLGREGKFLAVSAALLFSPTYVGIYDGNPGVIVIGLLCVLTCEALGRDRRSAGILLGITLCFKPQLAAGALLILAIRKRRNTLLTGSLVFGLSLGLGVLVVSHFGRDSGWWMSEQRNLAVSIQPGGQSDPAPSSNVAWQLLNAQTISAYVWKSRSAYDAAVWTVSAALCVIFWLRRRTARKVETWRMICFLSLVPLLLTYHRYYDAQLLLLLIPLLAQLWETRMRGPLVAFGAMLLILAFPVQSVFARKMGEAATTASLAQFMLLRNQPLALLGIVVMLAWWPWGLERPGNPFANRSAAHGEH